MALKMPRPTKHVKSGKVLARLGIPKHLREIVERQHGKHRTEFFENLGTIDAKEGKRLHAETLARFQGWLEAAQAEHDNRPVHLTDRQVSALCGRWLEMKREQHRDNLPTSSTNFDDEIAYLGDIERGFDPGYEEYTGNPVKDAVQYTAEDIDQLLAIEGLHIDQDSRERLARWMVPNLRRLMQDWAERNTTGQWRETVKPTEFAEWQPMRATTKPAQVSLTLDALLERWALDNGHKIGVKPIPRALYDRHRTIERLAIFVGHRDASRITKAVAVSWKDDMQRRDRHASTIRNDLSEMSAIWKNGITNNLVSENPFAGISPAKAKKHKNPRVAFTDEEAARIIGASREETGALRWLPIVLCMTGARLSEIAQSAKEDMFVIDGVNVIRIHDEGEGRSVKNKDSLRTIPIHPALVAEGFLAYVAALPAASPLFPDISPDGVFGSRGTSAQRVVARWFEKQGFKRKGITPNHSWRHWFMGACRRTVMPQEVRSAITGHSAKLDESAGYGDGMNTMIQVMATYLAKVKTPDEVVGGS